jgi:hypothetical protein
MMTLRERLAKEGASISRSDRRARAGPACRRGAANHPPAAIHPVDAGGVSGNGLASATVGASGGAVLDTIASSLNAAANLSGFTRIEGRARAVGATNEEERGERAVIAHALIKVGSAGGSKRARATATPPCAT